MKYLLMLLLLSGVSYSQILENVETGDQIEASRISTVHADSKKSCKDAELKLIQRIKTFAEGSLSAKGLELKKVSFRACGKGSMYLYEASASVEYTFKAGVQGSLPYTLKTFNRSGI